MDGPGHRDSATQGWRGLGEWWLRELASDEAYENVVTPLVVGLLQPGQGEVILDAGCGEGRLMGAVLASGANVIGVDFETKLLAFAATHGAVIRAELQHLPVRDDVMDAVFVSLVLEHLEVHEPAIREWSRVLRPGGRLVLVANHPMFTAPESAPIYDIDRELLWRPGRYFDRGFTEEPTGEGKIRFYHRTTADLLNTAAGFGLRLDRFVELGPSEHQIAAFPSLADQRHIPRLLGVRWLLE